MPYTLEWQPRGLYRRYFGNLTLAERRASLQAIVTDERFDALRYVITDYLDVQAFEDEESATLESAAQHIGPALTNWRILAAAVATRPDILASLATFKANAPPGLRYEIFATEAEARAWIAAMAGQLPRR